MKLSEQSEQGNHRKSQKVLALMLLMLISSTLVYNNLYYGTETKASTIASAKDYSFYVPMCYEGNIYYIYWISPDFSPRGELSPSQFFQLWNSSKLFFFEFITYENGTVVTNTTLVLTLLTYMYMWLTLEKSMNIIESYYSLQSPGYLGLIGVLENTSVPSLIALTNGLTLGSNYALMILSIIPIIQNIYNVFEGSENSNEGTENSNMTSVSNTTLVASILSNTTMLIEAINTSTVLVNLIMEYLNHEHSTEAQEIRSVLNEYGISGSDLTTIINQIQELPLDKQVSLISKLYQISTGQPLSNPNAEATAIVLDSLMEKMIDILVPSFLASLTTAVEETLSQGKLPAKVFIKTLWTNFKDEFPDQLVDSVHEEFPTASAVEGFVLTLIASVIENSWNLPNYVVYSQLLSWMQVTNSSYIQLNNYIIKFQNSNIINVTLTKELYYAIVFNNYYWSQIYYELYKAEYLSSNFILAYLFDVYVLHSNPQNASRVFYIASQYDFNISARDLALFSIFLNLASNTVAYPSIMMTPTSRVSQIPEIYIPITFPSNASKYFPYSQLFNEIIGGAQKVYSEVSNIVSSGVSYVENTASQIGKEIVNDIMSIRFPWDPPLVVINTGTGTIIVNGSKVLSDDPFAAFRLSNGTLEIVALIPNASLIGLESNETLNVSLTLNGITHNITLQPYKAQVYVVHNASLLKQNTFASVNMRGIMEFTVANGTKFFWISGPNGNLEVTGLPPGNYNVTNGTSSSVVVAKNVTSSLRENATSVQTSQPVQAVSALDVVVVIVVLVAVVGAIIFLKRKK